MDSRGGFIIGKCNNSIQPSIYILKCSLVEVFLTQYFQICYVVNFSVV